MKKILIIAPILIIIVLATIILSSFNQATPLPTPQTPTTPENTTPQAQTAQSSYIEYSQEAFKQSSPKRRILFFYASWCPTCIPADKNFTENANRIPPDVVLIRVNYNDPQTDEDEKSLAQKYNVTYQHTFVEIDSQGNEIQKWNGGKIDELLANIK